MIALLYFLIILKIILSAMNIVVILLKLFTGVNKLTYIDIISVLTIAIVITDIGQLSLMIVTHIGKITFLNWIMPMFFGLLFVAYRVERDNLTSKRPEVNS